jgi:NTE family protein
MAKAGPVRVAIACQGGGSHTAFTAGVLKTILGATSRDRPGLLDDGVIVALSGTSGGAVCALLAWDGLLHDDPERGAEQLESFWDANTARDPASALLNASVQAVLCLRQFLTVPQVSPYLFPPWSQDLLRAMLQRQVDFAALRALAQKRAEPGLVLGAVEVRTGAFAVFRGPEISAECVLASAAFPQLFPAVTIPERGVFWDGLFSQNPPVREVLDFRPDELWVVQINPPTRREVPTTVTAIEDRRNELSGNLSLEQELRFIEKVNEWLREGLLAGGKYRPVTVSRIVLDRDLDFASKFDRSPAFLRGLMAHGEATATQFLQQRRDKAAHHAAQERSR